MRTLANFADTVQMELAVRDIRRYQRAFMVANDTGTVVLVRWTKGWFAVGLGGSPQFFRPAKFRDMTEVLEARGGKRAKEVTG